MDDEKWERIADLGCEAGSDRAWFELAEVDLLAENKRLRAALELIAEYQAPGTGVYRNSDAAVYARRVLEVRMLADGTAWSHDGRLVYDPADEDEETA